MGIISLQTPVLGNPNTTEGPKIISDFTAIQNLVNGALDTNNVSPTAAIADSQLASPNGGVFKNLLQATSMIGGGSTYSTGGSTFWLSNGALVLLGAGVGNPPPVMWGGNTGGMWSVTNKTAYGVVQVQVCANATAPNVNLTAGLLLVTGLAGGTLSQISVNGTGVAGSATAAINAPSAATYYSAVSSPFALPTTGAMYVPYVSLSGGTGTIAANSLTGFTVNLWGYTG